MHALAQGLLVVGLIAVGTFAARSTACDGDDGKVKVTILVILAKEEGDFIDPKLREFAKEVQQKSPAFKSFRIKTMIKESMATAEKKVFKLVDGKTAQVVIKHGADKNNKVSLAVTPPDQGEIVYRTVCGKFLPIVTPYQTKGKERLMLAISVQPCNE